MLNKYIYIDILKNAKKCDFIKSFNIWIFQYIILLHTYMNIVWSFLHLFDRYWETLKKPQKYIFYNYFKYQYRVEKI